MAAATDSGARRANRSAVVVQADAVEPYIPAVKPETGGRLEMGVTNTERSDIIVDDDSIGYDFTYGFIKIRAVDVPKLRIANGDILQDVD